MGMGGKGDKGWPKRPIIYEINTWPWLREVSQHYKRPLTLGDVPEAQWDAIAALRVDAVWLMGVWERSPKSIIISGKNVGLKEDFLRALPDFAPEDNIGSAYSVKGYTVDRRLGGPEGLASAREMLRERGLRLILDFVPNHTALDHPWTLEHPEYFIRGTSEDLALSPEAFFKAGKAVMANGRDPYYPPWQDVAQVNAFHPWLRQASAQTANSIADQCDGMRCDMAMLLLNDVFQSNWGGRAGPRPQTEYWEEIIAVVRKNHPQALFVAEAYWDKEWELQKLGFDYCYDKQLYDRMKGDSAEGLLGHLTAGLDYQDKLVRFLENHDEPCAAATFSPQKERAYAVAMMTVPGAKLLNDGQLEGRKVRLPVFLARRQAEPVDDGLRAFYHKLLKEVRASGLKEGYWQLCQSTGWPDNGSHSNIAAWCWRDEARYLTAINISDRPSQALILLPWRDLEGTKWQLRDAFSKRIFERIGEEVQGRGLYVDLPPWQFHFLRLEPSKPSEPSEPSEPLKLPEPSRPIALQIEPFSMKSQGYPKLK